ncbi:uncharacterized protein [Chelonus insularis]|uniref:uncharacterized protein n=1 Tax=Chelonus insularis TaxID=460826 RepID=UPI0015884412|nr:uncharacterized protein LOC118070346 [Chelonus insularis]
MGRRKIVRSVEGEEEFQRLRRQRNAENQLVNQSLLSTDNSSVSNNHSVVNQSLLSSDNLSVSNDDSVVNQSLSSNNNVSARERQRLCQQRRNTISVIQNQNVNDINEYFTGEMDVLCKHCNAKHFSQEKRPPSIPDKLRMLFDYSDPNSQNCHEQIRVYNSSFSFASFNANLINFQSRRPGPYCFKIQGQVYYQINASLYPQSDDSPSFGHLFIIDSNEAITNRLATNSQLNVNILQDLDKIMRDHNMFAKFHQMMHEEVKKQEELALQSNYSNTPKMELLFTLKPGVDRRRFNLQQVNGVAAIFTTTADGKIPESYQWLVDNYVKIEKDQMTYHKNHQAQIRVNMYQGVHDHLQRIANDSNSRIGKVVVLSATFTGSPRNMFQNYQDSMAIVRKYGKPDLFVTMACNPHWKKITFFGNVAAYVYVIEFRKKGLPHIHLLITLNSNSKMTTPTIVDRYISAEIPDPNKNPILHDIVMKNMIHGPCGNWWHDCATVTVGETSSDNSVVDHDKIKNYIETRYVSPIKATWRILSKPLQKQSHFIVRLPSHLLNQQSITIDIEMNEDEMTNALADKTTMLTDYFKLNSTDELAKQYIYPEIPQHYVFKKKKIDGRNITSWEERKLHFNTIGPRGLIEHDDKWQNAMHEAEVWKMPLSLRRLFVRILIHCQLQHPDKL